MIGTRAATKTGGGEEGIATGTAEVIVTAIAVTVIGAAGNAEMDGSIDVNSRVV